MMAIRVYQAFFSASMPSACKFYPSCSHYAAIAIQVHGARRGSWLALKRLARCHPFTRGGVDLVPEPDNGSGGAEANGATPVLAPPSAPALASAAKVPPNHSCHSAESEARS